MNPFCRVKLYWGVSHTGLSCNLVCAPRGGRPKVVGGVVWFAFLLGNKKGLTCACNTYFNEFLFLETGNLCLFS